MHHICDDGRCCSQLGVLSAGFNSWGAFSGCARCANLNKGSHSSVQSSAVCSVAYHLYDEQAPVFTGNSVLL